MSGHGEKMTRRKEAAIAALLTEKTAEAAAAKAGISPATLRRWQAMPAFQEAYRLARQAVLDRTVDRLVHASAAAVATLERLLFCDDNPTRARAAVAVLTHATRGVEMLDFEARIRALEARYPKRRKEVASLVERNGHA